MKTKIKPRSATKPETPRIPTARLTLGGRERVLQMDMNALADAEEATGKNYMSGAALQNLSFVDLRALVYGCLLHAEPDLTVREVGAMLPLDRLDEVGTALGRLFQAFNPDAEGPGPLDGGEGAE